MKKLALMTLALLTGTLAFAVDLKPYDAAEIKNIMYSNVSAIGSVNKALAASDWNAVADGFLLFSQNAKKALMYAAPKGSNEAWAKLWNDFLSAAYQGVGAAGAKDAEAAKKFLDLLVGDRNEGHAAFKG